jgi:putative nucleotidyltransferase with HDIG domain
MDAARPTKPALILIACGLVGVFAWTAALLDGRVADPLTIVLALGAVVANVLSVRFADRIFVSASFTCSIVALAVVGPAAAFIVALVGELGARLVERVRTVALGINILGAGGPNLIAGTLFVALGPDPDDPVAFMLALAPVAILALTTSYMIVATLAAPTVRQGLRAALHPPSPFAPALLWAVPVAAGVAYVSTHVPTLGLLALVLLLLGVTYVFQLVAAQRATSLEHALAGHDLVAGMLHALQQRDEESARHAAAVAKYASDLARTAGLDEAGCHAAHAAGLMHDLGRLSIPDVALHADGDLSEREWLAIQRHPEAGAEMLRHVGVDGDVAEAVAAHHERVDGRGYPRGLRGDEIPELARIVAVAEVYDTLTAPTTYREEVSSFQALTELRRVSGSQLDERFVEALAAVLAHRPLEGRHATTVDLDAELAFERRLAQATVTP